MKYGLSYILLDGEELLEDNVINMRPHFNYISVILTQKSSSGIEPSDRCIKILKDLKDKKLVDEIKSVQVKGNPGVYLRNQALETLKINKCNYGCISDVDEFYESQSLEKCKNLLKNNKFDIIFTKLKHYYADENYAFEKPGEYNRTNCPFLFKISKHLKFGNPNIKYPYADPKRYFVNKLKYKLIDPEVCYVHHFWMVRSEIETKFKHRSFIMGKPDHYFKKSIDNWNNWKHGMKGMGFGFKEKELYKQSHTIKLEHFYKYAKKRL